MFGKILLALVLVYALVASNPLHTRLPTPPEFTIMPVEDQCVRQGGICVHIDDCDPKNLVNTMMRGVLCPKQSHLGAECCYLE